MLASSTLVRVACVLFLFAFHVSPGVSGHMPPLTSDEDLAEAPVDVKGKRPALVDESMSPLGGKLSRSPTYEHQGSKKESTPDPAIIIDLTNSGDTERRGGVPHGPILLHDAESRFRNTESHLFSPRMECHQPVFEGSPRKRPRVRSEVTRPDAIIPYITPYIRSSSFSREDDATPRFSTIGTQANYHEIPGKEAAYGRKFRNEIWRNPMEFSSSSHQPIVPGHVKQDELLDDRRDIGSQRKKLKTRYETIQVPSYDMPRSSTLTDLGSREIAARKEIKQMKSNDLGNLRGFQKILDVDDQADMELGRNDSNGKNQILGNNSSEKNEDFQRKEDSKKFWVWISMIWQATPGIVISELQNPSRYFASQLEEAISHEFENYAQNISRKHSVSNEIPLHKRLVYFVNTLWSLNWRVLDLCGAEFGSEVYIQAQEAIQKWLLNLLLVNEDEEVIECWDNGNLEGYVTPKSTKIKELLFKYLISDENEPAYHAPSTEFRHCALEVSERELLLIKAVMKVTVNYHTTQNQRKWVELFLDEEYFLKKMARMQRYISIRQYRQYKSKQLDRNKLTLLPWKEKLASNSVRIGPPPTDERSAWLESNLDLLVQSLADKEMKINSSRGLVPLQVGKVDIFNMGKHDQKVWAWISMLKMYDQDTAEMEDELRLNFWKEKSFQDLKNKAFPKTRFVQWKVDLDKNADEFLKQLWKLHSILLRLFGREVTDPKYFEEQKALQEWVLKQFDKDLSSTEGLEKIEKVLITRFLISTGRKTVYQTYKFSQIAIERQKPINILQSDIHMIAGVIHTFGSYYKSQNPGKWKTVFQEDHNLPAMFYNIQCKIFSCAPGKSISRYLEKLKTINLMPWEEDVGKLDPKEVKKIKRGPAFQNARRSQFRLDKWVRSYT